MGTRTWRSREKAPLEILLHPAGEDGVRIQCVIQAYADQSLASSVERHVEKELREAVVLRGEGFHLHWEEMDPEVGAVRRYSAPVGKALNGRLTPGGSGVEILGVGEGPIWVASDHTSAVPTACRARAGWTVRPPRIAWRYAREEDGAIGLRMAWECAGLPEVWVTALPDGMTIECQIEPEIPVRLVRVPSRSGLLRLEGRAVLPNAELQLTRHVRCRVPLALAEAGQPVQRDIDEPLPAEFRIRDVRAVIDGVETRFVAEADRDKHLVLLAETDHETVLPNTFPAGSLEQIPWDVRVELKETGLDTLRWEFSAAQSVPAPEGLWRDVTWEPGSRPALRIALAGSADDPEAARVWKIYDRRLRRTWDVERGGAEGSLLRLVRPVWTALDTSVPELGDAGPESASYQGRVCVRVQGSAEYFDRDGESEVPRQPLLMDPQGWSVRDPSGKPVEAVHVYGAAGGHVRWRRPVPGAGEGPASPCAWAERGSIALVVRGGQNPVVDWGGFWVPEAVPWERLVERTPTTAAPDDDLRVHASPRHSELWMYLWGFLASYRKETIRLGLIGDEQEVTAWVSGEHLPLFPVRDGALLRAFCPLCVFSEPGAALRFTPQSLRPVLSLGAELLTPTGGSSIRLEPSGPFRLWCGWGAREACAKRLAFVAGGGGRLTGTASEPVIWAALDQVDASSSTAGWLLSRGPDGQWWFRGFYAAPGSSAVLGDARDESGRKVRLVELPPPAGNEFSVKRSTLGEEELSGDVPPGLRPTDRKASSDEIIAILAGYQSSSQRLPDGGEIITYVRKVAPSERSWGIRVWEAVDAEPGQERAAESAETPFYVE